MAKRDLLNLFDLTGDEIRSLVARGREMKRFRRQGGLPQPLAGQVWGLLFEKDSLRTRLSFETGITLLGGTSLFISAPEIKPGQREPVEDIARVVSGYLNGFIGRVFDHHDLEVMAQYASIPVINALSDQSHPCQLLADLMTMDEAGVDWDSLAVAWVGDGNNVAFSYIAAAARLGFELRLACPPGYQPRPELIERARKQGASVIVVADPAEAVAGADIISTDVWTSMGQEAEKEERLAAFSGYLVDNQLLALAAPGVKVMHCLPAHRGEEITAEVLEGPASIVFAQAENRLYAQMALLELLASY